MFSFCPGDIVRVRQLPEAVCECGDEGEVVRKAAEPTTSHGAAMRNVEGAAERGQSCVYRAVEPRLHVSGGTNRWTCF